MAVSSVRYLSTHLHQGQRLLESLPDRGSALTDEEIELVVDYLERDNTHAVRRSGSEESYVSDNLKMGTPRANLNHLPADKNAMVEQFDQVTQTQAFAFIKSDARIEMRLRKTQNWIRIAGIKRPFYHHQLYAAFWLLKQERGARRGAIEADLMGLGKTTIAYLYIIFNFLLCENARDIELYPRRHCRASEPGVYRQPLDARCPSGRTWPIACACEESSITSQIKLAPREGASLIIVPAGLIGSWDLQWVELGVNTQILPLQVYIHHRDYQHRLAPSLVLEELTLVSMGNGVSATATMTLPRSRPAHRTIIITSIESYHQWVQVYCQRSRKWTFTPSFLERFDDFTDGLAWGRVLKDEAHLTANYNTMLFRILESLASSGWVPPNFVGITGTPMLRKGVADLIAYIKVINMLSPELTNHPDYTKLTQPDYLNQLVQRSCSVYKSPVKRKTGRATQHVDIELADSVGLLLSRYCIRRRSSSFQNGKVLASLPPLDCYDIACRTTSRDGTHQVQRVDRMLKKKLSKAWSHKMMDWQARGNDPAEFECDIELLLENAYMNRILATVPGLAQHGTKKDLTWERIQSQDWHKAPELSPFYRTIGELERSSGKLQALRDFLNQWLPSTAWDGLPEKLVIISEFAMICHVVACFCHHLGISYHWMHADTKSVERGQIVDAFQAGGGFRVLIGSAPIMGQGWTLNRAHRLILMEPSHHAAVEEQNAERVHRLGSKTDRCWFYRLINTDSTLEHILTTHQDDQRRLSRLAEWFHLLPYDDSLH